MVFLFSFSLNYKTVVFFFSFLFFFTLLAEFIFRASPIRRRPEDVLCAQVSHRTRAGDQSKVCMMRKRSARQLFL